MASFKLEWAIVGQQGWARICGPATMSQGPGFMGCLQALAEKTKSVWVDFAGCDRIDSTFAGCLVGFSRKSNVPLHLANLPTSCNKSLSMMNLDKCLDICNTAPPNQVKWQCCSGAKLSREEMASLVIDAHDDLASVDPKNREFARVAEAFRADLRKR